MRTRALVLGLAAVMAAAFLVSCGTLARHDANPIAAGCEDLKPATATVCGYSIYGTFLVGEKTGVKVATDAGPGRLRNAIIAADETAKPIFDSLLDSLVQYELIRIQLAAGTTTQAKLDIALQNVVTWISNAKPAIKGLTAAIAGK